MKTLILMAVLAVTVLAVSAQSPDTTVDKPANRAYDEGHCFEYEMKMLYSATTIGDPNQESYLRAAQAYKELDANGQKCGGG